MQDQGTWDLRAIYIEPSMGSKLYMLLLFVSCVAAIVKLFKLWACCLAL